MVGARRRSPFKARTLEDLRVEAAPALRPDSGTSALTPGGADRCHRAGHGPPCGSALSDNGRVGPGARNGCGRGRDIAPVAAPLESTGGRGRNSPRGRRVPSDVELHPKPSTGASRAFHDSRSRKHEIPALGRLPGDLPRRALRRLRGGGLHETAAHLDSGARRPLRLERWKGTEGAYQLFWSPNSRQLGFFADQKLKKLTIFWRNHPRFYATLPILAAPRGGRGVTSCSCHSLRVGSIGSRPKVAPSRKSKEPDTTAHETALPMARLPA
jgi:hypothetical protein